MCVDFMDIKKHYLKDFYPLLSIDLNIEVISNYKVLNFLNLYREYHQVLIDDFINVVIFMLIILCN